MAKLSVCIGFCLFIVLSGCIEKSQPGKFDKALSFKLVDTDSTYRQMSDFKGKIIMIHFWADWCPHCRQEFPELQRAYDSLRDQGFLIVGINSGQTFDHVIGIQQEFNLSFPMLVDKEAKVAKEYQVSGLPTSFFVDADGNILKSEIGWVTEQRINEIYRELTEESSYSPG